MTVSPQDKSTLIIITNNGMGKADQALQHKLMKSYLRLLNETGFLPGAIGFYTDGVKLVVEGSPVLDELKLLEEKGVFLIVCSTCLNYFNLMDKVQVGIPGHMTDIIELLRQAEKVITI